MLCPLDIKAPKGILVIVVLSLIASILNFYTGSQIIEQITTANVSMYTTAANLLFFSMISLMLIFLGVFWVAAAFGLLTIKPWGWNLAVWSYLSSIPLFIICSILLTPYDGVYFLDNRVQGAFVIISVISFLYLRSHPIKKIYISST